MRLDISSTLSLPSDAVTQTFGCIGRKGSGKTYLAGVLAEQMLDIRAQVIVLDPVGNWWGLRVDADGKSKGKSIFVIGGEHGDIPITAESGAKIARVLVEKGASAVLDISGFRQGERKRFAGDFAEEFFHLKKTQRSAVHLFVEEAQLFVPQRCGPDEARMLGAYENIIRLGRNYGIGATLISQRPQSVNKEVLSQVECLCVLQVNGAHERKAIEEWVQEHGADRKLIGELPGLARGEGFVWSPSWLRVFERVKFSKKTTFDASATPEVGKQTKTAMLSVVDVESLKSQLHEVISQAEKDDPKALRKRIAELEKASKQTPQPEITASLQARIRELESYSQGLAQTIDKLNSEKRRLAGNAKSLRELADILEVQNVDLAISESPKPRPEFKMTGFRPLREPKPVQEKSNGELVISGGARRMLEAAARMYPHGVLLSQIGAQAGLKTGSGTFGTYKSQIVSSGLVRVEGNKWYATELGMDFLGESVPSSPASTEDVLDMWLPKLGKKPGEMLHYLIAAGGDPVAREELGNAVGITYTSGTFGTYLSALTSIQLAISDKSGIRANKETLFL